MIDLLTAARLRNSNIIKNFKTITFHIDFQDQDKREIYKSKAIITEILHWLALVQLYSWRADMHNFTFINIRSERKILKI